MWFVIAFVIPLAQAALATQVKLGPKVEVAQIDLGKLGGTLVSQLAWSPDGNGLYLQTQTEDKRGLPKDTFHFVMPAEGGSFTKTGEPPDWASAYWTWKSGQTAPDDPALKISISQERRVAGATAIPMGGDLAKGGTTGDGTGATAESAAAAANASMNAQVTTLLLKGEVIGEWVNHRTMPGTTFGWGPSGTHLIAYAEKQSGRLVIMDATGARQKVDGTKGVLAPAWSNDGARIAYLESRGRNKYALIIATVSK
ncbi:MAG TPA: hypothetical protein VJN96_02940 [Vicinamibacterales bacterium]|nr:hypothetical protein [Vicinamibacterales bacterium]